MCSRPDAEGARSRTAASATLATRVRGRGGRRSRSGLLLLLLAGLLLSGLLGLLLLLLAGLLPLLLLLLLSLLLAGLLSMLLAGPLTGRSVLVAAGRRPRRRPRPGTDAITVTVAIPFRDAGRVLVARLVARLVSVAIPVLIARLVSIAIPVLIAREGRLGGRQDHVGAIPAPQLVLIMRGVAKLAPILVLVARRGIAADARVGRGERRRREYREERTADQRDGSSSSGC